MSHKPRFLRAVALDAARQICRMITPHCDVLPCGRPAIKVCGSLRRGRQDVGDVEIVYIPVVDLVPEPADLLGSTGRTIPRNRVDAELERWLATGLLAKRPNKLGHFAWGQDNKLAIHTPTGVPVDLFSTDERAWHSYVVCRTGSAETNTRIATAALRKGWRWHPTGGYFTDVLGKRHWIGSEEDVFRLVGLPYLEPKDR